MAAVQRIARDGQPHGQRSGALHLRDQLVVVTAVQALLHQHGARESLRQRTEQLAHGIRTTNAGQHQYGAAHARGRFVDDQFHRRDAAVQIVEVVLEAVGVGRVVLFQFQPFDP